MYETLLCLFWEEKQKTKIASHVMQRETIRENVIYFFRNKLCLTRLLFKIYEE